jgi:hypothetical protein
VNWLKQDRVKLTVLSKTFDALDPEGLGYFPLDATKIGIIRVFNMQKHDVISMVRRFAGRGGFDCCPFQAVLT